MFELVGYRFVDMKTTDGGIVKGYSCFFLNHEEQDGLEGAEAMKQFFSSEKSFLRFDRIIAHFWEKENPTKV